MPTEEMVIPGQRTVRAWFDTFFRDFLSSLTRERKLLEVQNWTWQSRPPKLVMIRSLDQYTDPDYLPNFEQFKQLNQDFERVHRAHDEQVETLGKSCSAYHLALKQCPEWQPLFIQINCMDSVHDPERLTDLLLDLVVNGSGEVPDNFPVARSWNPLRDRLLKLREVATVQPAYSQTKEAASDLLRSTLECSEYLERVRRELALRADVPIVLAR
ncbi:MAG: hypothetical protein NTV70_24570 [Acidobacteria bacterium]|nr:hypothetical protein [Acidobacteriota bacterium]